MNPTVIVLAKRPRPGRVKTRLCPPCSDEEAARIAAAALELTIASALRSTASRLVLACDEDVTVPGFETIRQRGEGLGERLTNAFADVGGPAVLVGMDTPQLTPRLIDEALEVIVDGGSVIGPTQDGGYWGIGLPGESRQDPFARVPMSRADTFEHQIARLRLLGHEPKVLPELRDVDVFADARAVARLVPESSFAELVLAVDDRIRSVA